MSMHSQSPDIPQDMPLNNPQEIALEKARLRQEFRTRRRSLSDAGRESANQAICTAIETIAKEQAARRVTAFLAFDGEPDIAPALQRLHANAVTVCLPVVASGPHGKSLSFLPWLGSADAEQDETLRPNQMGIREPVEGEPVALADIDIVLMPLVAWDRNGGRLGMGAGYYDRALAALRTSTKPLRVGIAYDEQEAEGLPMTALDVPLQGIITQSGLFTFNG